MALTEKQIQELQGAIGVERLRANPAAVRCVHCQRVHEKTFAGPSTSSL